MLGEEKLQNSAVQNQKKHCMAVIGLFIFLLHFSTGLFSA